MFNLNNSVLRASLHAQSWEVINLQLLDLGYSADRLYKKDLF